MTTRTAILILCAVVVAFMLCGCDDLAEFITGDNGAYFDYNSVVHFQPASNITAGEINLDDVNVLWTYINIPAIITSYMLIHICIITNITTLSTDKFLHCFSIS